MSHIMFTYFIFCTYIYTLTRGKVVILLFREIGEVGWNWFEMYIWHLTSHGNRDLKGRLPSPPWCIKVLGLTGITSLGWDLVLTIRCADPALKKNLNLCAYVVIKRDLSVYLFTLYSSGSAQSGRYRPLRGGELLQMGVLLKPFWKLRI